MCSKLNARESPVCRGLKLVHDSQDKLRVQVRPRCCSGVLDDGLRARNASPRPNSNRRDLRLPNSRQKPHCTGGLGIRQLITYMCTQRSGEELKEMFSVARITSIAETETALPRCTQGIHSGSRALITNTDTGRTRTKCIVNPPHVPSIPSVYT
jgi:hypothetical protein